MPEVIPCVTKTLILSVYGVFMHVAGWQDQDLVTCRAHALALGNLLSAPALCHEDKF